MVFKNTGGGGFSTISDRTATVIVTPLGLLPETRRVRVNGVSSAHHKEMGGHPTVLAAIVGSVRTHDPRPLQAGATKKYVVRTHQVTPRDKV